MPLMDLLTIGRSLSEARERRHRYKVKSSKLPTFGNPAGPVLEKRFGVGAAPGARRSETSERATGTKRMKREAIMEEQGWSRKGKADRSAEPPETVQGELSLDKVKPVRNDLSDSDLELKNIQQTDRDTNATKGEVAEAEIPLVKAQPLLARVLALFQRRN